MECPSTCALDKHAAKVKTLLHSDRCFSVRLIAEDLNMYKITFHKIISANLKIRMVCPKLVPKVLSGEQKQWRVDAFSVMMKHLEKELDFLDAIITGDIS